MNIDINKFVRAVIVKYHSQRVLKYRKLFFHNARGYKSNVKVSAGVFFSETSPFGFHEDASSL